MLLRYELLKNIQLSPAPVAEGPAAAPASAAVAPAPVAMGPAGALIIMEGIFVNLLWHCFELSPPGFLFRFVLFSWKSGFVYTNGYHKQHIQVDIVFHYNFHFRLPAKRL